jgi:hypothetical protein
MGRVRCGLGYFIQHPIRLRNRQSAAADELDTDSDGRRERCGACVSAGPRFGKRKIGRRADDSSRDRIKLRTARSIDPSAKVLSSRLQRFGAGTAL